MIIKNKSLRFGIDMWGDCRVFNMQSLYCLCTRCKKTSIRPNETQVCPKHDEFVKGTNHLEISAPIFMCTDFDERVGDPDFLGMAIVHSHEMLKTIREKKGDNKQDPA